MHHVQSMPVCGEVTHKGPCQQSVLYPGKKCPQHTVAIKVVVSSKVPPMIDLPLCFDCHAAEASKDLLATQDMPVCDASTMIVCAKCTHQYHPVCVHLTTPRQIITAESYPWSCPDCKVCSVCQQVGDESTLMICDGCDRGWHTGCCVPEISSVPEGAWLCKLCAECHSCNDHQHSDPSHYSDAIAPPTDTYSKVAYLATYCRPCHGHFDQHRFCPVCLKTFTEGDGNEEEDGEMVACDVCDHWIHTKCDETLTPNKYQSLCDDEEAKYACPLCANRIQALQPIAEAATKALKGLSGPQSHCVGLLGGRIKIRGVLAYQKSKVGVPQIKGAGVAEMSSL
ncbi:hypothetical protein BDF14DRAFT_1764195 [Spinellus fusiger]|nr:hypothetical protein BDF14DRAFT_1764195 [Spinellus fusiger]